MERNPSRNAAIRTPLLVRIFAVATVAIALTRESASAEAPAEAPRRQPNVVLIFADDLGYGDLGCYGGSTIPTPNLDTLAARGVRFTDGYVTGATCAPSRCGIMTGAYQARFGMLYNTDQGRYSIPRTQVLMPEALSAGGYRTALIGKWNLSINRPAGKSFDEVYSLMDWVGDYFPVSANRYVMVDGNDDIDLFNKRQSPQWGPAGGDPGDAEYLTDRMGRQAVEFIEANRERPFFLYLAFNAPHSPWQAPLSYRERFPAIPEEPAKIYAAMVTILDENVGKVLQALDRLNLRENTLVVFLSDNGPSHGERGKWGNWRDDWPETFPMGSAGPLRARKGWYYEGGFRIPYILSWPGRLPEGKTFGVPVSSVDLYPTFCAAAGVPMPATGTYDGINLLPEIDGSQQASADRSLYWNRGATRAIRCGDWKLYRDGPLVELYNLRDDIGETRNRAEEFPERVKELTATWEQWERSLRKDTPAIAPSASTAR